MRKLAKTAHPKDCQCDDCPAKRQQVIHAACDEVSASVKDRRENGGAASAIRSKALDLIRQLAADLV